jgi:YegS/Rv2252/BmrU family lipid kinase
MAIRVARIAARVGFFLALAYLVLVGVGLLLTRVLDDTGFARLENDINSSLADGRTDRLNDLTYVFSGLGNTVAIVGALIVVATVMRLVFKQWREAIFLVLAVAAQALVFLCVQLTISRQRPDVERLDDSPPTSSFPSGHTGAATALFVASALLVAWYVQRRWVRILGVTVLAVVPLLVAYARLHRGMHHPTDVLAAYLNALACIAIAGFFVLGRRGWGAPKDPAKTPEEPGTPAPVKRAAFVYNPLKVANVDALKRRVEAFMARAGWDAPLWLETTEEDPGLGMCERAVDEGCTVVFVCGGDGTIMAAATALAGGDVPMAILPAGTGNLLARNLGLPLDDEDASLRIGVNGTTRAIDVGAIEDRTFVVMAGLGFDAAIMRDAPERLKKAVGWPAYLVSASQHLRGPGIRVTISIDDAEVIHRRVRTVVVGNVGKLQGGILLIPDAKPDDGVLDVVLIAPRHAVDWLRVAGRVVRRANVPDRTVERFRGQHVVIEASRPQPRQLDGDLIEDGTTMDIRIEPHALGVKVAR